MHTRLVFKINIEMRVTRTRTKDEDVHNLLRKSIINLVVMIPSSSSSSHIVQICCNNYEVCTCAEIIGTVKRNRDESEMQSVLCSRVTYHAHACALKTHARVMQAAVTCHNFQ